MTLDGTRMTDAITVTLYSGTLGYQLTAHDEAILDSGDRDLIAAWASGDPHRVDLALPYLTITPEA